MTDLTGRVALVTGASSGIGAAIAGTFAGLGAHVVVNSVSSVAEGEALAAKAVERARNCVAVARRVASTVR